MSEIWLPKHMRRNASIGSDALIYFRRVFDGRIIIPPIVNAPLPVCKLPQPHDRAHKQCVCGYVKMEANSSAELQRVSKLYEEQKRRDFAEVDEAYWNRIKGRVEQIRSKLRTRLANSSNNFERDVLRAALKRLADSEANLGPRRIEGHLHIEETEAPLG